MKATKISRIAGVLTLSLIGSSSCLHAQSPPPSANAYNPPDTGTPACLPAGGYRSPLDGRLYPGFDAGVAPQQDVTISDSIGDSEKVTFDPGDGDFPIPAAGNETSALRPSIEPADAGRSFIN